MKCNIMNLLWRAYFYNYWNQHLFINKQILQRLPAQIKIYKLKRKIKQGLEFANKKYSLSH